MDDADIFSMAKSQLLFSFRQISFLGVILWIKKYLFFFYSFFVWNLDGQQAGELTTKYVGGLSVDYRIIGIPMK